MKKLESAANLCELDSFSCKLSNASNALFAIQTAIEANIFSAEEFKDGLFFICCTIEDYSKELRSAVDRAFEQAREGVKNGKVD